MAKAKAQQPGGAFARDLGYLDAFFDKLEAHGRSLGGAAGQRLEALIGEERQRWVEIRALIEGRVTSTTTTTVAETTEAPTPPKKAEQFTVGPLRGRK